MSINTEMTALADAIRSKSGVTGKLSIAGMTSAVGNIVINPGGGETVDLSFVTATAGDILSGKVGADKNGKPVHGTLELTGGSDIDLSGVTVTADKMLDGVVAVGADGNKVTGNIQTVAASSDGEYVTIPAGFHASEQRFPITSSGDGGHDTSTVTATADTMLSGTIAIGKSGETIIGNIQTVTPVRNANVFTVAKGYVAENTELSVPASVVTETETSVTIEPGYVGETLNFEIGGNSGEDVIYGVINENGQFQPLDLSGEHPVETGSPEVVDLDVFNTGFGEPAYLPADVGGSGAFDIVTVTKYTPAIPAGKTPEVIRLSGFTDLGSIDVDNNTTLLLDSSMANGLYEVTPETKDLEERHRVYRHMSRPYIELKYTEDLWDGDRIMGWTITNPIYALALLGFDRGEIVWFLDDSDGYKSFIGHNLWYGQVDDFKIYSREATGNIEYGGEDSPDKPAVIEGHKAVSYNNGRWSFKDTTSTFSKFDETPEIGSIYAATGDSLIGPRLDAIQLYTSDSNTVLMLNFNDGTPKDVSRFNHEIERYGGDFIERGYSGKGWNFDGGWLSALPNVTDDEVGTEFVFGNGDFTWEAYVYPTSTQRQCLFAYGEDHVFGVCFSYDNDCKLSVFGNTDYWNPAECSDPLELYKWHHVAIVRKGYVLYCFINFRYSGSVAITKSVGAANNWFSIGRWGDDPGDFQSRWQGYMDDIRISNVARYEI